MAKKILKNKNSLTMILVAVGVVYGDIATSPMYVMRSIVAGNGGICNVNEEFIIGALSLIIWTVTLLTTVKHVLIAMKADNHGEGGIFALFAVVRKYAKWLVIPAMIGGATLLADSILTPAVTVTTAIEGLRSIPLFAQGIGTNQTNVIIIVLIIILILFSLQRAGTSFIGKTFGPFMTIWFLFLAVAGIMSIVNYPWVLKAINPIYAAKVLVSPYNVAGFMILGSVFLATTGAEALYSDMGHVGKKSIYISWPFVKACLLINYLGQGAWIIVNAGNTDIAALSDMNPFYLMLDPNIRIIGIILGAMAAIIASQALITGSFTIVSEAIKLNLLPHMLTIYPSETKGQLYIPLVNWILWLGCTIVVLLFRTSANMEAAYGLAITITLLMVTILLTVYLHKVRKQPTFAALFAIVFGIIETIFFVSCIGKFFAGGYFAIIVASLIFLVMISWYVGTQIERTQSSRLRLRNYIDKLDKLRKDSEIPTRANNLVFMTDVKNPEFIERSVMFSILEGEPKRAQVYWFVNMTITERPFGRKYKVENFGTDFVYRITIILGYKEHQRVNAYLYEIVYDLLKSGELKKYQPRHTIFDENDIKKYRYNIIRDTGSFKYVFIRRTLSPESDLPNFQKFAVSLKYTIRKYVGSHQRWFGLENSVVINETVPLFIRPKRDKPLTRITSKK